MSKDDKKYVWIVEHRQHLKDVGGFHFDSVTMYVASSFEKARQWCKENTDSDEHDPNEWWWFTIAKEEIDPEGPYGSAPEIYHVDWNGVGTNGGIGNTQPIYGYEPIQDHEVMEGEAKYIEEAIRHYELGLHHARTTLRNLVRHGKLDGEQLDHARSQAYQAANKLDIAANSVKDSSESEQDPI